MELLTILLLALAVSMDGLAAGLSLGMRDIRVPLLPLLIISMTSALSILLAMLFGTLVASIFSFQMAQLIGALVLFLLGGYWILQYLLPKEENKIFKFQISLLGIVVEIRRQPLRADLDLSGGIDSREAYLLGFALAMDAAGVGLGASFLGLNLFLIPLAVGVEKFLLLLLGMKIGRTYRGHLGEGPREVIPGLLLILLGIVQLISCIRG